MLNKQIACESVNKCEIVKVFFYRRLEDMIQLSNSTLRGSEVPFESQRKLWQ